MSKGFTIITQILTIFKLVNIYSAKVLSMQDIFHLGSYFSLKVLVSSCLETLHVQLSKKNEIEIIIMMIKNMNYSRQNTCSKIFLMGVEIAVKFEVVLLIILIKMMLIGKLNSW